MEKYDFCGWATRNNIKCSDGRTIIKDAFKHNDGKKVPLIWMHDHSDPTNVLGHALLENREEGVYAYCTFNDTEKAVLAKKQVMHGDLVSLSIYANGLKQDGSNVIHGSIRELSLVLAGANPGAMIESIICHEDGTDEEAIIYMDGELTLSHSEEDDNKDEDVDNNNNNDEVIEHSDEDETVEDILKTFNEKQMKVLAYLLEECSKQKEVKHSDDDDNEDNKENESNEDNSQGGNEDMKHNVFDKENENVNVLSHSDTEAIIALAQKSGVGSLQNAIVAYAKENNKNELAHGIDEIETLFPEYKDVKPGAPELIKRDLGWVDAVMKGVHKSPISRIRTRQAKANGDDLRALGYQKGKEKKYIGNLKLINRTTDPQTIYVKDKLHRDDIIDMDWDVVEYQYGVMKDVLNEEIATAIMIGDGREDGDDKIYETHVRSIWNDDELYTIHKDVDFAAAKAELQGTNTGANFGDEYIKAEATIKATLFAKEEYKGSGVLDMYCTPHFLNEMLLARDLNGRRIYDSVNDLAAALNVGHIYTAEQFANKTRTTEDGKTKKLLALLVNLDNYHVGSTKNGQITRFSQFDIDYNQEKYLIETRISGASVRIKSAIALEEDVTAGE